MKGLELSRRYYETVGRPALQARFGEQFSRMAVGLVGEGSECFGYDDAISADHDYGPGFCIWLTREDYRDIGEEVRRTYDGLPRAFMGVPPRVPSELSGQRVGVWEISSFYARFVGPFQPPRTLKEWLYLREDKLAEAVNGQVFFDPLGEFSRIRKELGAYYPEDVRIKKIAARCAVMAQAGQYNYPRCMRRGDTVAAALALSEFLRAALSLMYLFNRTYCPYYKWQFHGLKQLSEKNLGTFCLPGVIFQLERLVQAGSQTSVWEDTSRAGYDPYVNRLDEKMSLIEGICISVVGELRNQGLTQGDDPFLQTHLPYIMDCIRDETIRACHVLEG